MSVLDSFAILIGKATRSLMLMIGKQASTLPGRVTLTISPKALRKASRGRRIICITGTNGKTTTTSVLTDLLRGQGHTVVTNRSGANMQTGLMTTMMTKDHGGFTVLEVDEAALARCSADLDPEIILVTNIFRDQLDRYGEIDTILKFIKQGCLQTNAHLVLCADDPRVAFIGRDLPKERVTYYAADVSEADPVVRSSEEKLREKDGAVTDEASCPVCKQLLEYSAKTISHQGFYKCSCGYERPEPDLTFRRGEQQRMLTFSRSCEGDAIGDGVVQGGVGADAAGDRDQDDVGADAVGDHDQGDVGADAAGDRGKDIGGAEPAGDHGQDIGGAVAVTDHSDEMKQRVSTGRSGIASVVETVTAELPLDGFYNAYNACGALAAAAQALPEVRLSQLTTGFASVRPQFGRLERFSWNGRELCFILVKNPAGMEQGIRLLSEMKDVGGILFFLNNLPADGADVSWIWDVDMEQYRFPEVPIGCGGLRRGDMALRLTHALGDDREIEVGDDNVEMTMRYLQNCPEGRCLYLLPNYTVMLKLREELSSKIGYEKRWE